MDGDKERKRHGAQKVDGARRLAPPEQVQKPGTCGIDTRRHREPGQNCARYRDEDDAIVSELLKDVVARRRLTGRKAQPKMLFYIMPDIRGRELATRRQQVALDVATNQSPDQISDARQDEQPGECQVPFPRGREVVMIRYGDQRRKGHKISVW